MKAIFIILIGLAFSCNPKSTSDKQGFSSRDGISQNEIKKLSEGGQNQKIESIRKFSEIVFIHL